jgi:hypothetical protein
MAGIRGHASIGRAESIEESEGGLHRLVVIDESEGGHQGMH